MLRARRIVLYYILTLLLSGAASAAEPTILFDFEEQTQLDHTKTDDASVSIIDVDGGRAMRVDLGYTKQYPGVTLTPTGGPWDLSRHSAVEVDLTNAGDDSVNATLRVDNKGHWRNKPWNVEKLRLKPGQSKTLRVEFGRSWGGPGYVLDPSAVTRVLVFVERPKHDSVLIVDNLRAVGPPMGDLNQTTVIDSTGKLIDFEGSFDFTNRVEDRGTSSELVEKDGGKVLRVHFTDNETWPGVFLKPPTRKWDLSRYTDVEMDVTNESDAPVTLMFRVDNPNADGRKNSNTERLRLKPGQTKTAKVTFGRSWGGAGFDLDKTNVVGVLLFADNPKRNYTITVDNLRAIGGYTELPEWLGQRPPVEGDWVLTLDENFDGETLNEELWNKRLVWNGPHKWALQAYTPDNLVVKDGKLHIVVEKRRAHQFNDPDLPTREYASGIATTFDKWTQAYGYFEGRMKFPRAGATWPAFWLMPDRGRGHGNVWERRTTDDGGMEFDIMEHLAKWGPGRYSAAVHWDGYGDDHQQWGNANLYYPPTEDGFHVFGMLWEPDKVTWFCDGKEMVSWESDRIMKYPAYIKLNVEMGGWAGNRVSPDSAYPDAFVIDYVRVWQRRDLAPAGGGEVNQ